MHAWVPGGHQGGDERGEEAALSPGSFLPPPEIARVQAAQEDPLLGRGPPLRPPHPSSRMLKKKKTKMKTCLRATSKHRFDFPGDAGSGGSGPLRGPS